MDLKLLQERISYVNQYRTTQRKITPEYFSRIMGTERRVVRGVGPYGTYAWIECAVRGGSGQQIEICKDMSTFFTAGRSIDRVDFDLTDGSTGVTYTRNAYRYRSGNMGYRVEVNTDLGRALDLGSASRNRDIVLFQRSKREDTLIIRLLPNDSPEARGLIEAAEQGGRLKSTTSGQGGRLYYV